MASQFVIRQDTLQILSLQPVTTEFLAISPEGIVTTTGIPSGNFDNYTLLTTTANLTGNLQNQIDSLSAASSGGIASINNVESPGGNIDLVTSTSEITITPNDGADEIAIDIDLSSYATLVEVANVSGNLQTQIDNIEQESTVIESSGGSILVTQPSSGSNTYNLEVASAPIQDHNDLNGLQGGNGSDEYYHITLAQFNDFIGSTEVAAISAGLDSRITSNDNDISALQTDVATISGDLDSLEATVAAIDVVSGTGINVVESPADTWTVNVVDYISATEVASVSAGLDSRIDDLESTTSGITGGLSQLDDRYVNIDGDTMTGSLTVPDLTVTNDTTINGNLYVNGTEFIVNTEAVSAEDNIIVVNAGEVGPGVTAGEAGIRVDRGSADDYFFVFDEVRDAFAIGSTTDETSGSIASLQLVATREDSPLADGFARWNDSLNRFDTVSVTTISNEISGTYVNTTGDTMTGDLTMSSANISVTSGTISIDDATQGYGENLSATAGTEIIDSFSETVGYSAEWLVSIRRSDNGALRTSKVYAIWDRSGTVEFSEVGPKDIGNTNQVDLDVVESSNDIQLRAIISGGSTWEIKAIRTTL